MARNKIDANVRCPSCNGQLFPRVLVCDSCGLKVEGDFVMNEFGSLTPDELHFLRVFIYCEGRIRDMEAALGVSYPTVKGHLATIKQKLNLGSQRAVRAPVPPETDVRHEAPEAMTADEVLEGLESGQVSYKDAVNLLRSRRKGGKTDEQQGS
jgi:hypothetical protein